MRTLIAAALAVAVLAAALHPLAQQQPYTPNAGPTSGGSGFDGSILYTLLLQVLEDLASGDYASAAALAGSLAGSPAPVDVASLHSRVYEALEGLARALLDAQAYLNSRAPAPRSLLLELEELGVKVQWLLRYYSDALERGIPDKALAREYSERLQSLLEAVTERVEEIVAALAAPAAGAELIVEAVPVTVPGGGVVHVHITAPQGLNCNATVTLAAGGVVVESVSTRIVGGWGEATLATPDAGEAEMLGLVSPNEGRVVDATVEVRAECAGGERGYGYAELSIAYLGPGVTARIPGSVTYGEAAYLVFNASREANISLYIDGEPAVNLTVKPPGIAVELDSAMLGVGNHTVEVEVEPSGPYVRGFFKARLEVAGRPFEARAYIQALSLWPLGYVEARLDLGEGLEYRVEAYVGGEFKATAVLPGGVHVLRVPGGIPLIPGFRDVEIRVEPVGDGYQARVFRARVLVASPLALAAAVAVGLAALAVQAPGEWAPGISGVIRAAGRAAGRAGRAVRGYAEYLKLRIPASRVARLYRRALRLLGIPAPLPSETLREHYARAVEPSAPQGLRGHLARLMEAAERDLYSARKPSLREAERLLGVIRRARRKG